MPKTCAVILLAVLLTGCATTQSRQAQANSHVKPYLTALNTYHQSTGDYPEDLGTICPRYLQDQRQSFHPAKPGDYWRCSYQRVSSDEYTLQFYTPPCSVAIYQNGKLTTVAGPAFNH